MKYPRTWRLPDSPNRGADGDHAYVTQQLGGALGIAIIATVAANESGSATDPASLVAGYNAAFMIAAALAAALVLAAIVLQRRPAREEAAGSSASRGRQGDRFATGFARS